MNQRPPSAWERFIKLTVDQTHGARASSLATLSDELLDELAAKLGVMLRHQLKACASTHEALGDVVAAALDRRR